MTQASGSKPAAEFSVVVNSQRDKKYSILQFQNGFNIEKNSTQVTLARENNLKDFKTAHNIGMLPTSGAGSEFGREAKEEARRRKLGYIRKNYNPDNQPWMMQVGADKKGKKLKGTRNGGILENSSYFVFIRKPDGVFEAVPVDEWYNFKSTVTYNNLNDEEAEEEFARRDRTLNLFNVMVRKKLKKEDVNDEEDSKEKLKSQKRKSGLMLTEMEDWADLSEEDEVDAEPTAGKGTGKGKGKGKRKKKKDESDDEAFEDSDDGDAEAKQVDYMSDTSDSDSDAEQRENKDKYAEQGVDEGMGDDLKDVIEEPEKEENNTEKEKKEGSSSGSSSESESDDPDQEDNEFTKAFLMAGGKKERNRSPAPRSTTPISDDKKRKLDDASSSALQKRIKTEPPADVLDSRTPSLLSQSRPVTPPTNLRSGVTEEGVKRYLMRKPMSSKDLVKIFKSKKLGLSIDEMTSLIAEILKRLKPTQTKINDVLHFSYP